MRVKITTKNIMWAIVLLAGSIVTVEGLVFARIFEMGKALRAPVGCACGALGMTMPTWQQGILLGLGGLFCAGIIVGIAYALVTLLHTRRLVARVTKGSTADKNGIMLFSGGRCEAFTFGFFKPKIALCAHCVQALSTQELHAMVSHEKRHVAARDPLRFFVLDTLKWTLFFVPLLRTCVSWYRSVAEIAADEGVVDKEALGSALLRLVQAPPPVRVPSPTAVSSFASSLTMRIERLVNPSWNMQMHLRVVPLMGLLLLVAGTIGTLTYTPAQSAAVVSCKREARPCAQAIDASASVYYNQ